MGHLLSSKLYKFTLASKAMYYWCPGCEMLHPVYLQPDPSVGQTDVWQWNGDVDKPTFSPSLLLDYSSKGTKNVCHVFIKEGKIQFLSDCTHALKNQTVPLPNIPGDEIS